MTRTRNHTRPTRSVRMMEPATPDVTTWTVRVTVADEVSLYDITPATIDGRYQVWLVRKVQPTVTETVGTKPYVVDVGNEFGASCDCPAGKFRGHCRHVEMLLALTAAGKLPAMEPACGVCHGTGGPQVGDADADGSFCRGCGE